MMLQEIYDDDPDNRTQQHFLINDKMFLFENLLYNGVGLKKKIFFHNV